MVHRRADLSRALGAPVEWRIGGGRRIRLVVQDGVVRIGVPRGCPETAVLRFVLAQSDWIRAQQERHARALAWAKEAIDWDEHGQGQVLIFDQRRRLHCDAAALRVELTADRLLLPVALGGRDAWRRVQRALRTALSDLVLAAARQDLAALGGGLPRWPRGLDVRALGSLWGSLTARDLLRLNLALVFAPRHCLRYVVAHELAHLWERNHGPRFWHRVAELDPAYALARRTLRQQRDGLIAALARIVHRAAQDPADAPSP